MKKIPPGEILEVFSNTSSACLRYRRMKRMLLILLLFAEPSLAAVETLTACRQIEDIAQRVACYDNFVDARFPMESSDGAATITPPEESESSAVPDAKSLFGTSDAEAKQIVEMSLAIEQIDNIVAYVTDVQESATRKLVITLENGQVWRQLDNQRLPLKTGETVVIRKASLGSFLLEKDTGSRNIRVKRTN
jgi:hypothetical protein